MNIPRTLSRFNTADTVVMITAYPEKGELYGDTVGGLASYAKNVAVNLAKERKSHRQKIMVLADYDQKPSMYLEHDVLVYRCFKRGSFSLYRDIIDVLKMLPEVTSLCVQFEFAAFGGFHIASLFPILLSALKLSGKHVSLVLHQVIFDLNDLAGHLGFTQRSFFTHFFSWLLSMYYLFMTRSSNQVIVLENHLKNRLLEKIPTANVVAIPHGVDVHRASIRRTKARQQLGFGINEIVLVSFGYLTWYKGSDRVVKLVKKLEKLTTRPIRIVLAGGPSATQADKPHYQEFYRKLQSAVATCPAVDITGFVSESQISLYYSAADLVLLPYRTMMSSSGPLSLAYTYRTPCLLSQELTPVTQSDDVEKAMKMSGLTIKDLTVDFSSPRIARNIITAVTLKQQAKLRTFSSAMRTQRAYAFTAQLYQEALTVESEKPVFSWQHIWKELPTALQKLYPKMALPALSFMTAKVLS